MHYRSTSEEEVERKTANDRREVFAVFAVVKERARRKRRGWKA